jgi:hypothetical protein
MYAPERRVATGLRESAEEADLHGIRSPGRSSFWPRRFGVRRAWSLRTTLNPLLSVVAVCAAGSCLFLVPRARRTGYPRAYWPSFMLRSVVSEPVEMISAARSTCSGRVRLRRCCRPGTRRHLGGGWSAVRPAADIEVGVVPKDHYAHLGADGHGLSFSRAISGRAQIQTLGCGAIRVLRGRDSVLCAYRQE